MQTDTFFSIGKTHKVCEDYAQTSLPTNPNNVFAISDGCSSSKDTDFGSRILLKLLCNVHTLPLHQCLYDYIWNEAVKVVDSLMMSLGCLDATINFGYKTAVNGVEGIKVTTVGDGFIVAEHNDGGFEIVEVEYDKNAPYYLSYVFDKARKDNFMQLNQKKTVSVKVYDLNIKLVDSYVSTMENNVKVDEFSTMWFPLNVYKSVSVFSDGLKTFAPNDQSLPKLPFEKMVKELITFPVPKGEFVKRRGLSFLKKYKDYSFLDDFSMATTVRN